MQTSINVNQFQKNGKDLFIRNNGMLITLDDGELAIYEDAYPIGKWKVQIDDSGEIDCDADDFYIARDILQSLV